MIARIPILDVEPVIEGGAYPAKASVGERFEVSARVFREGHDQLGAGVVLTDPEGSERPLVLMVPAEDDLYAAEVTPDTVGAWTFRVESWGDPYATWLHDAPIKVGADVDTELMLLEGALLFERALAELPASAEAQRQLLEDVATTLRRTDLNPVSRLDEAITAEIQSVFTHFPLRELVGASSAYPFFVDRRRAAYGAWYEFFPRSEGARRNADGTYLSGTFATAAERLPAVADMAFDVIYLPPVHPIGRVNRKGPNNTLTVGPDDPGSPWAIGSAEGGHDTIHPELGTFADFDAFVARAGQLGLEVALDLALQCAPDHPWVTEHPQWFGTRADGSIAYAENPPKKYQDIYPLYFDNDPEGIFVEVLRVVRLWMSHGVRIFRVDNPHTKPVAFWQRLLGEIRDSDPDVVFLSEAFTKPAMMRALGMMGFHQSYTYFTWRETSGELGDYLTEVAHESSDVLRPNFFVNTPDILPGFIQRGGGDAFAVRAVLAATGSPSWGVYAGYELFENLPLRPGSEEYVDSEKFQIKIRDWDAARASRATLAPYLTRLNQIRRAHPALQQLRDLTLHASDNNAILCFSKQSGDDTVIVVVNNDPWSVQESTIQLQMPALGFDWDETFVAYDELSGASWAWGEHAYVRLGPSHLGESCAHIIHVR